jgi:hypothetical protein
MLVGDTRPAATRMAITIGELVAGAVRLGARAEASHVLNPYR